MVIKIIMGLLALFGVLFIGLMLHEATHIIQSRKPISVCWDFQQQTVAHTFHDTSAWPDFLNANNITTKDLDGYAGWALYSEKWATFIENFIYIIGGVLVGVFIILICIKDGEQAKDI